MKIAALSLAAVALIVASGDASLEARDAFAKSAKKESSAKSSKSTKTFKTKAAKARGDSSSGNNPKSSSLAEKLYNCSMDDIVYFNSKYAEFIDVLCEATESLALRIAADSAEGKNAYLTGDRTEAESLWFDFMDSHAYKQNFTVKVDSYRRTEVPDTPVLSLSYPDLDSFLNGYSTGMADPTYLPGFYALQTFREEGPLFINPNGGASGYHKCNIEDGTATSKFRTFDGLVSLGSYSPNVAALAKIYVTWQNSGGTWLIKDVSMVADQMGIISY